MKKHAMFVMVFAIATVWAASALAADSCCAASATTCSQAPQCGQKADADGFITLFDGKNLDCWQNARNPKAENKWFIEDGAMTNADHANDIGSKCNLKDFELSLEYKTVPGGNSGVYLRGRVEVQVLDSFGKAEVGNGDDGAIYGQTPPKVNASKKPGEWSTLNVSYAGDTLTVKLNGQVVHENLKITQPTGGALPGGVDEAGPIMLQGDHKKVWYRNIRIKPLDGQAVCQGATCPVKQK